MIRAQALTSRTGTKTFRFLFVTASVWFGALVKWDLGLGNLRYGFATAFLGEMFSSGSGCRLPALLRVLLLLPLVFPAWKQVEARENSPSEDASVISALVTAEETLLTLSPKMGALSMGLLDLRLPGPAAE